jgi:hypothetical protein
MNFCDLRCRYAAFPKEDAVDGAGSCRTFSALYCERKRTYVHKNMPCDEKEERKDREEGR